MIFVASAFNHPDTDALYASVLKPACAKLGYAAFRVDMAEPPATITDSILNGINAAQAVIADLTYASQSVYFETGYAFGLGLPLLLTCRKDHMNNVRDDLKLHFDLAQFKLSTWEFDTAKRVFMWPDGFEPVKRLEQIVPKREE